MNFLDADRLISACANDGQDAGITIRTELEPLGGPGAKVKPAVYAGSVFQTGKRWWGQGEGRRIVDVITIDNEPSQANRLEASLKILRADLGLPEFILDLTELEPLPPHIPRKLSSFQFPHRNADAYLRDALLNGSDFLKSDIGKEVFAATGDNADALIHWFPQSLIYGFWQSHLGKKGSQAKLARSWVSEIVGIEPATGIDPEGLTRSEGLKGDPLNLTTETRIDFDPNNATRWEPVEPKAKSNLGKIADLAEIGHGQVPVSAQNRALAGVSFQSIHQQATVSFSSLRRISTTTGEAEARALLAGLGLIAHVATFGRAFNLRSGCDLRPVATQWTWIGASGDRDLEQVDLADAQSLFRELASRAEDAGLPVGSNWQEPVVLTPKDNLAKVIRETFPEPEQV